MEQFALIQVQAQDRHKLTQGSAAQEGGIWAFPLADAHPSHHTAGQQQGISPAHGHSQGRQLEGQEFSSSFPMLPQPWEE